MEGAASSSRRFLERRAATRPTACGRRPQCCPRIRFPAMPTSGHGGLKRVGRTRIDQVHGESRRDTVLDQRHRHRFEQRIAAWSTSCMWAAGSELAEIELREKFIRQAAASHLDLVIRAPGNVVADRFGVRGIGGFPSFAVRFSVLPVRTTASRPPWHGRATRGAAADRPPLPARQRH